MWADFSCYSMISKDICDERKIKLVKMNRSGNDVFVYSAKKMVPYWTNANFYRSLNNLKDTLVSALNHLQAKWKLAVQFSDTSCYMPNTIGRNLKWKKQSNSYTEGCYTTKCERISIMKSCFRETRKSVVIHAIAKSDIFQFKVCHHEE